MPKTPTKLLVVVNVFRPDLGGGVLFTDLCEGLSEKGFDVTVKCAYSYYPEWEDKSGMNGWRIRSTTEGGLSVERHGLFIPRDPNSLLQRLVYEASFYFSLRRRLPGRESFDAILAMCPLVGGVAYAGAAKRRTGAPLWLNVQDLSAQAAAAGGIMQGGFLQNRLLRFQNRLFAKADVLSSISESMVDILRRTAREDQNVELIPNWLHRSLAEKIERQEEYGARNPSTPVELLYSGNIGTKQDLLPFCQYLSTTQIPFRFVIQGSGGRAPELRAWLESRDDARFEMRELSDEEGLVKALRQTDYFVITEKTGVGNSFIPSKLIPGISTGTPILAICDAESPLGTEMNEYALGPQIEWTNLDGAQAVLSPDTEMMDQYEVWSSNARARSRYYGREQGIGRCANLIEQMIKNTRKAD